MFKLFLITGTGGFLGSGLRYLAQRFFAFYFPVSFPYGTMIINIAGSLLIGIIYALGDRSRVLTPEIRLFLTVGLCGGFTTFSTFSFDAVNLIQNRAYLYLGVYILASVILSITATIAGIWLIKSL
jgi:fluoride exporter